MPTDYTPKLQAAKAKLQAKGMLMQFVRRTEDTSQMPEPGGGYPVIETRTDFYGLKTSPTLAEVQMGIFGGEDLVVIRRRVRRPPGYHGQAGISGKVVGHHHYPTGIPHGTGHHLQGGRQRGGRRCLVIA